MMTITQDGLTRLRKSADTSKMLLDYDALTLLFEGHRTIVQLKQEHVVVARMALSAMRSGDTLDLTSLRGSIEVDIHQTPMR